jgi:hypothetical protein
VLIVAGGFGQVIRNQNPCNPNPRQAMNLTEMAKGNYEFNFQFVIFNFQSA